MPARTLSSAAPRPERRGPWVLAAASALTVLLLGLALPPVGWSALAWVAFVPLLAALRAPLGRAGLLVLWLAGMAYGIEGFFYIRHVSWLGMLLLAFYISIYFVLFGVLVRWLSCGKGVPLVLTAPVIWTALEEFRGVFLTGLPWLFVGHTQYERLAVIQIADLAGVAGVTFWILAVNAAVAEAFRYFWRLDPAIRWRRLAISGGAVLVLSAAALAYGHYRLNTIVVREGPRVAVLQGNIPQDVKNRLTDEDVTEIFLTHVDLTEKAIQKGGNPPDLVLWPETMAPMGTLDLKNNVPENEWIDILARPQQSSNLLVGAGSVEGDEDHPILRNSTFYLPRGGRGATERYDKIHLVPFGEYVPLKPLIGRIVGPLIPYKEGLTPGDGPKLFEINGWHFAPTICYEDGFPRLVRRAARAGPKMDFIVNVTNEGWFKDGIELDQHLAIAAFRAVENRAGFIRSANTGISAFLGPTGRVLSKLEVGGRDREVAGVLHGRAVTTDARSPYLTVGETFGDFTVLALAVLCLVYGLPHVRSRLRRRRT